VYTAAASGPAIIVAKHSIYAEAHVTAEQLPAELAGWPAWTPGEAQLGELELIISGAFTPLGGYLTTADLTAVAARSELADGTPWPMPVTLTVPASAIPADEAHLVLQDPEGSPLAVLDITELRLAGGPGRPVGQLRRQLLSRHVRLRIDTVRRHDDSGLGCRGSVHCARGGCRVAAGRLRAGT